MKKLYICFLMVLFGLLSCTVDDEYGIDENNSSDRAETIELDKAVKTSFEGPSDKDYYNLVLAKGGYLKLTCDSIPTAIDLVVHVESEGKEVAESFVASGIASEGWNFFAPPGNLDITMSVFRRDTNSTAKFSFKVVIDTSDIYEYNNTEKYAKQITLGQIVGAAITTKNDVDYYSFDVPSNGIYDINWNSTDTNAEVILQPFYNGSTVGQASINIKKSITKGYIWEAGKYMVSIYSSRISEKTSFAYKLSIDTNLIDTCEYNQSKSYAKSIALGAKVAGTIYPDEDVDYFKVSVSIDSQIIAIKIDSLPMLPMNLEIEDSLGSKIGGVAKYFGAATFEKKVNKGTYFFKLTGMPNRNDRYGLTVSIK